MKTSQLLKSMKVVSWIIFIGICIKAGAILISFLISLFIDPEVAKDLYMGLDLLSVQHFSHTYYVAFVVLMLLLLVVQAFIFFWVIKLFAKFNEQTPFSLVLSDLISKISYATLIAGGLALIGTALSKWLVKQGIAVNYDWSAQEFIFMGAVVFIFGLFYKRGIEIQSENELTI